MAPPANEPGIMGRRKSTHLFSRASMSGLTHINTGVANEENEKKEGKRFSKRNSIFGIGPSTASPDMQSGTFSPAGSERSSSPKLRPRTLQKGRPGSLFGSLGKRSLHNLDEGENDNLYSATPDSPVEDGPFEPAHSASKTVLQYGEVQTTSGMFRKKKEFLVLTDTHLLRFKSQSRAADAFPSIPHSQFSGRSTMRHPSTTSIGSLQETQSNASHASAEYENRIPLGQIVTAYKVEDGRPFFTTEVVYLDEEYHGVGSIQLMLHDPKEADLWHGSIRAAAQKARLILKEPFPERVINYLVQALEVADDYDVQHFKIFRVVRRAAAAKSGKLSSDDLQKLGASVFYLVVGINRLHLIPLPDFSDASGRLAQPKSNRSMFGLVTLVSMNVNYSDDRFELAFRMPLQPVKMLELAASATPDIAVVIFAAHQYLKPQWLDYSFLFGGPRRLLEELEMKHEDEEYGSFDRTLVAYCMAYKCNPTNIQYAIDWELEDAPEFRLFPPVHAPKYSVLELLAIMRSLRYNESFQSISFKDIDLHGLHGFRDNHGTDHVAWTTREGSLIERHIGIHPQEKTLLYQEAQALALKSRALRKMDYSNTLPRRRPRDMYDVDNDQDTTEKDPGSEIVAGIMPLIKAQLTNVTWIVLNDVELGETDLDDILPALDLPTARIRAIECQHSGLTDRGIMQLLKRMEKQGSTVEHINIANNPGRIHLEGFQVSMSRFTSIRKLNLSRMANTYGDDPLFVPEVILSWKLEELILTGIPVNVKTLEAIAAYLASKMSDSLSCLEMDQCNLTGTDVALLMRCMTRVPGQARKIQLQVSANRLEKGVGDIVEAIKEQRTPSHLVIRMIEFTKEDHFRELLVALRTNTTIQSLDISKASLPYDASPETCEALRLMFVDNSSLEELDISGEYAHLEVTRFGIGLNQALTGLKNNKALKILRIEYQSLGLEGANTLATVFKENECLTHVQCDHNNISLQGFTILVNSIAHNYTVLDFPFMQDDQDASMKKLKLSMTDSRRVTNNLERKTPMRRTLTVFGVSKSKQEVAVSTFDVNSAVREIGDMWTSLMKRLSMILERNRNIALGIDVHQHEGASEEAMRPSTAMSEKGMLDLVVSNSTPKVEFGNPHDNKESKEAVDRNIEIRDSDENDLPSLAPAEEETTPKKPFRGSKNLSSRAPMIGELNLGSEKPLFEMDF